MNSLGGIITNGLGLPAANNIIVNFFNLTIEYNEPPVTPEPEPQPPAYTGSGGGGVYPGPSHVASRIEQPMVPYLRKTRVISIRVKIRDNEIEKVYEVSEKYANTVISIMSLINKTQKIVKVSINNIKRISSNIYVTIKNIRRDK